MVKTWTFTAVDPGSIPGWRTKTSQAAQCGPKKRTKFISMTGLVLKKYGLVLKKDFCSFGFLRLLHSYPRTRKDNSELSSWQLALAERA